MTRVARCAYADGRLSAEVLNPLGIPHPRPSWNIAVLGWAPERLTWPPIEKCDKFTHRLGSPFGVWMVDAAVTFSQMVRDVRMEGSCLRTLPGPPEPSLALTEEILLMLPLNE